MLRLIVALLLLYSYFCALNLMHGTQAEASSNGNKMHGNHVAMMVQSHFLRHGVRLPTPAFLAAMRAVALDISHLNCLNSSRRPRSSSLVLLAMANEEALRRTVPLFLRSLAAVRVSGGRHAGSSLDSRLVMVAWSRQALGLCEGLQASHSHQCVRDPEHRDGKKPMGFHSDGFNALGFAKIKYILNGLSAGHDVLFLDADIVVLRDPVPYFFDGACGRDAAANAVPVSGGADMYVMMEKCLLVNTSESLASQQYVRHEKYLPPLNIGTLYFKATAAVTRCVYSWVWDMYGQVPFRPHIWDQDIYGVIIPKCAYKLYLRLQALDPRLFQSACYPRCGCDFADANVSAQAHAAALPGVAPVPGSNLARGRKPPLCEPRLWEPWLLRHFACSGTIESKERYMRNFLQGAAEGKPVDITRSWPQPVRPLQSPRLSPTPGAVAGAGSAPGSAAGGPGRRRVDG